MASYSTSREKFYHFNSLLCLAKSLENRYTTIDLRNEISITGKVTEVDGYMNVILSDAALYHSEGNYQYFPLLYIQARNIRNVHIPENVSITKAINKQVKSEPKPKVKKPRTFKESRALKYQQETLKLIKKVKEKQQEPPSEESKS